MTIFPTSVPLVVGVRSPAIQTPQCRETGRSRTTQFVLRQAPIRTAGESKPTPQAGHLHSIAARAERLAALNASATFATTEHHAHGGAVRYRAPRLHR